jgi:predicted PurR-regulated permease PerM
MAEARTGRPIVTAAALVVVVAGLQLGASLVEPLLAAIFLAIVTQPLVRVLEKWRVPHVAAVLLVLVFDLAILGGIVVVVGQALNEFYQSGPRYRPRVDALVGQIVASAAEHHVRLTRNQIYALASPESLMSVIGLLLKSVASLVGNMVLVVLVVAFALLEAGGLRTKMEHVFSRTNVEWMATAAQEVQTYLFVKTGLNLLTGICVGILVMAFHIDYPLLWAFLAFLFNFVPTIGTLFASLPPILLALLVRGPGEAAIFAGLYTVLNVLIGNVLEPRVLGRALGLSPLVVLLSMIFWGWLWGPLGALLAVPLTMAAKIVLSHTEGGKPIAILLGPPMIPPRNSKIPPPPDPEAAKAHADVPPERA